jgi:hypothetical protein
MEVKTFGLDSSGCGLFASQNYKIGDVILTEKPLYIIGEPLNDEQRTEIMKLKNSINDELSGYLETNQITINNKTAIFKIISRCNHCCLPNARYFWNTIENLEYLIVIREIKKEEEITVSYGNTYFMPYDKRKEHLANWNFVCLCDDCKNLNTEPDRQKLYDLDLLFQLYCSQGNVDSALSCSITMLNVILKSILKDEILLSNVYYDIYQVLMYMNRFTTANINLKKYLNSISICETPKSQNLIIKSKYLENPENYFIGRNLMS